MTKEQIMEVFNQVRDEVLMEYVVGTPERTGALKRSITCIINDDGFSITFNKYYVDYVEKLEYNKAWKSGRRNYNYQFIKRITYTIVQRLAQRLGGDVNAG